MSSWPALEPYPPIANGSSPFHVYLGLAYDVPSQRS